MNVSMRYSEAFKQQVLRELGEGKHESVTAALRAYGIGGSSTIQRGMRRYGREDFLGKLILVRTAALLAAASCIPQQPCLIPGLVPQTQMSGLVLVEAKPK